MRVDRPRRQEQLRRDLLVRHPFRHVAGDLQFLGVSWSTVLASRFRAVSPVARSSPRARSAQGSARRRSKPLQSGTKLGAGVGAAAIPAQVLAVEQADPGEIERPQMRGERERRLVVAPGLLAGGEQSPARSEPRLRGAVARGAHPALQPEQRCSCLVGLGGAYRRLILLGERKRDHWIERGRLPVENRVEALERVVPAAAAELDQRASA